MSLLHSDVNISRCESCGGWQYMDWCWTCERPTLAGDYKENVA